MRKKLRILKILEYHDIFPEKGNVNIKAILRKYNRKKLIQIVNVLSLNYGNAFMPDTTFFSEISKDKIEELNDRFQKFAPNLQHQRICYCTQRTILELLRYIFSIPIKEYRDNGNEEDLELDLFLVVIQLNENLMKFSGNEDDKKLPIMIYFLRYVLNDVIDTSWKDTCKTQIFYFYKLKEFLELEDNNNLCAAFCNKLNIETLDEYFVTVFGLVALYVEEQQQKRKGCPLLVVEDNELLSENVCDYLSLDINATYPYDSKEVNDRDCNIDYRIFRSHPLIKYDKGKYYIYNLPLLCERLYNSLFFDLKSLHKGNFFQFYNGKFVEHYLFQHTMLECVGKKSTVFFHTKKTLVRQNKKTSQTFISERKIRLYYLSAKELS